MLFKKSLPLYFFNQGNYDEYFFLHQEIAVCNLSGDRLHSFLCNLLLPLKTDFLIVINS